MKNKKQINEPTLSADETRIFIRLLEIVQGPIIYVHVSKDGLAKELGLPLKTVKDTWKRFIKLGLLKKSEQGTLRLNPSLAPSLTSKR